MKKIFTLFVLVLMSCMGAWAQTWGIAPTNVTVSPDKVNGKIVYYYIKNKDADSKGTAPWVSTTGLSSTNTSYSEQWAIYGNTTTGFQFVNRETGKCVKSNNTVTDTSSDDLFVSNGLSFDGESTDATSYFDLAAAKTSGYFVIAAHDFQNHHYTWSRNGNNGSLGAWYSASGWNWIGWKGDNNGDNGCMFQFVQAEEVSIPYHTELQAAISEGTTLLGNFQAVRSGKLITLASQFDNTCGDSEQGTNPGNLINGSTNDLWHSDWHGRVDGDQYLGVTMPEGIEYTQFEVEITPRGDQDEKQERPTEINVYGYKDGEWTSNPIQTFTRTDGLGETTTATLRLNTNGVVYTQFRFVVTKTYFNNNGSISYERTDRKFFALSEFQMYGITPAEYNVSNAAVDALTNALAGANTTWSQYNYGEFEAKTNALNNAIAAFSHDVTIVAGDNGNFGTFCWPYATTVPAGVNAYTLTSLENDQIVFTKAYAAGCTLPAEEPVLLVGESAETVNFKFAANADKVGTNLFLGTPNAEAVDMSGNDIYVLAMDGSDICFMRTSASNVNPYKAYIKSSLNLSTKAIKIDFDGPTAINGTLNNSENTIFDLSGRKVSNARNGFYIVNGKKVLR